MILSWRVITIGNIHINSQINGESEYLIRSDSGVFYDDRRFTNDESNDI